MTPDEFKILYQSVKLRLPGVDIWIGKQKPTAATANDVTQTDILQMWANELKHVRLEDAQAAVEALYREEVPEPKSWSRFPVVIRRYAQRRAKRAGGDTTAAPKPTMIDGEWTYECPECQDVGWITCLHPKTQEDFIDDPESFRLSMGLDGRMAMLRRHYTCAVPCTCRMGDVGFARHRYRINGSWCRVQVGPSDSDETIHAWLTIFRDWWLERNQAQQNLSF